MKLFKAIGNSEVYSEVYYKGIPHYCGDAYAVKTVNDRFELYLYEEDTSVVKVIHQTVPSGQVRLHVHHPGCHLQVHRLGFPKIQQTVHFKEWLT